jgi:hypothetical protein
MFTIDERVLGPNHPELPDSMMSLAQTLTGQGR